MAEDVWAVAGACYLCGLVTGLVVLLAIWQRNRAKIAELKKQLKASLGDLVTRER